MARVMRWTIAGIASAHTDILTPPVGKKYEIIGVSVTEYGGTADLVRPELKFPGPFYLDVDEFPIPAGTAAAWRNYNSILCTNPFTFSIGLVAPPGFSAIGTVFFMDVDV